MANTRNYWIIQRFLNGWWYYYSGYVFVTALHKAKLFVSETSAKEAAADMVDVEIVMLTVNYQEDVK